MDSKEKGERCLMKLKDYLEWKHSKKLKRRKKNGNTKRQRENRNNDSQRD